jgi:hypothetical protein
MRPHFLFGMPSVVLFHNVEQLDFKNKRRAWLNHRRGSTIAIRQIRRAYQAALATDFHLLHTFRPTFDDVAEWKGCRLIALDRTVEYRAVDQGAVVVHLHRVGLISARRLFPA